jgi:hypothetical protein
MRSSLPFFVAWLAVTAGCDSPRACAAKASQGLAPLGLDSSKLTSWALGLAGARRLSDDGRFVTADMPGFHDNDAKWCPNNSYFEFFPSHPADVTYSQPATFQGSCFGSITAHLQATVSGVELTLSGSSPKDALCGDVLLAVTPFEEKFVDLTALLDHNVTVTFSLSEAGQAAYLHLHGVQLLHLPCGLVGTIESAIKTVGLFVNSEQGLIEANADFFQYKHITPPLKPWNGTQPLTPTRDLIPSGSYLAILRLDGLDPMVAYGTGGVTGHSAVAVWEGDQLYITESTAANPFGKVYWPPPYGIIRHKFEDWFPLGVEARYHVALLPLRSQYAAKFDEDAFWEWFRNDAAGQPYGFHNFVYSFIDTPHNLPEPADNEVLMWLLTTLDRLSPGTGGGPGVSVYSIFVEALSHRGPTGCTNTTCVEIWADAHNTTLGDIAVIPEQDSWRYDDGKNMSRVCSAYAADVWKHAGLFDLDFYQATEQTPKDNYQMAIFDGSHFDKTNCPIGLMTTANGDTYCQLMGPYFLPLNDYNTIVPYQGMNNHCPSQWPDYVRCPASNPQCC